MSPSYFPILKWKKGEQDAVRYLKFPDRLKMLPIIEPQAHAKITLFQALKDQLGKTGVNKHPVAIDLRSIHPGGVALPVLAKLCQSLQHAGFQAHPAINSADAFADPSNLSSFKGFPIIVLRLDVRATPLASAQALMIDLRHAVGKKTLIFVVADIGAIGDSLVSNLVTLLQPFANGLQPGPLVTRFAVAGGSFPFTLQGLPQGAQTLLPRKEWQVWQQLRTQPGCADTRFGDYAVTNPLPMEIKDPTKMNPSAAIRYTLKDSWRLFRAGGVKTSGFGQYNTLCKLLIQSTEYAGQTFSYGDDRYHFHAQPGASTGNLTTWRRDATNHHLVQTMRQLPLMP